MLPGLFLCLITMHEPQLYWSQEMILDLSSFFIMDWHELTMIWLLECLPPIYSFLDSLTQISWTGLTLIVHISPSSSTRLQSVSVRTVFLKNAIRKFG
jgi:hypothetical protein